MRALIRNADKVKVVTFNPTNNPLVQAERPGFCGLVSSITWGNEAVQQGLRHMFSIGPHEEIVAIELTDEGIKAKIEYVGKGARR